MSYNKKLQNPKGKTVDASDHTDEGDDYTTEEDEDTENWPQYSDPDDNGKLFGRSLIKLIFGATL